MTFRVILACLALLSAPYWALYAQAASGGALPNWAERIDGFRLAKTALSELQSPENREGARLTAAQATVAKAKLAYSKEPLATDALFVATLASEGDRLTILSAAREINKRSQLVGLSLLELAARRSDTETVLSLAGELTRVDPQLAPQFVSILSSSLTDERALPLLEQALSSNPLWAVSFWRRVPEDDTALTRFVELREKISPPEDFEAEKRLLQALVTSQRFSEAYVLYSKFAPQGGGMTSHPPFDWRLVQTRDARAREIADATLDLFIQKDTSGKIAEKLVKLTAGEYLLAGAVESRLGDAKLEADLQCASQEADQKWSSRMTFPGARWSIPEGSCSFAWLTLSGSTWDRPLSFEGTVVDLKFERVERSVGHGAQRQ